MERREKHKWCMEWGQMSYRLRPRIGSDTDVFHEGPWYHQIPSTTMIYLLRRDAQSIIHNLAIDNLLTWYLRPLHFPTHAYLSQTKRLYSLSPKTKPYQMAHPNAVRLMIVDTLCKIPKLLFNCSIALECGPGSEYFLPSRVSKSRPLVLFIMDRSFATYLGGDAPSWSSLWQDQWPER